MQSSKKYTNQTFTKRVDHEAGSHHSKKAMAEPAICEVCGDVYADRRWSKPDANRQSEKHPHFRNATIVVCPACKRIADKIPSGYVYLSGAFLTQHFEEISQLLHNEAERASEDNPLARIMESKKEKSGDLTITTTTEHLAQLAWTRTGKSLRRRSTL